MVDVSHIAEQLRANAEAVCRRYLSNGRRSGNYWLVGNVMNEKGASLHVRLTGPTSGPHAAGRWCEYVAAVVMLRFCDLAFLCGRLPASTQHNVGAWREIS